LPFEGFLDDCSAVRKRQAAWRLSMLKSNVFDNH
jgi:hypothetical protein